MDGPDQEDAVAAAAGDGAAGDGGAAAHAGVRPVQRWPPMPRPAARRRAVKKASPETVMRRVVQAVAAALPRLAADGQWTPLLRSTQLLLWLTQHAPGSASMFIAARGTARIQEAVRAATSSDDPAAAAVLQPGTALLLQCVQLSEGAADLVVESQSVRLLLQLLLRPGVGATTKRHVGGVLQALAATKLVYRDVLHGAGVVDTLMAALTDAAVLSDLLLVQELLWVLISLADDDLVYKDDMREAGLPALLVALLSVYQANHAAPELRPVAAQVLRCLQLMAAGDEAMADVCAALGLTRLLVGQLHLDIHQLDEPPLPAAASHILTLNSLPGTPRSPLAGAGSVSFTPASPLRRSGSGGSSPRPGSAGQGGRHSVCEPSIPEDKEAELGGLGGGAGAGGGGAPGPGTRPGGALGGRGTTFGNHGNEAGALRGLGAGPSPLLRLAAALLLRRVLAPVMSRATIEVLLHGMLVPALHMQLVGPRLSLAAEATFTLRALLADSPERAAATVRAGAAPLLVQLLSATNLELASTAADVLTLLASSCPDALVPLGPAAVAGLTELLREAGTHSYALSAGAGQGGAASLSARHSAHTLLGLQADGRRRASLPGGGGDSSPMSPIPEAAGPTTGAAAAEQAAGTVWAGEGSGAAAQQQQEQQQGGEEEGASRAAAALAAAQQLMFQRGGGAAPGVLRHPSLGSGEGAAAAAAAAQHQHQHQQRRRRAISSSGMPVADHLTSRHRPHPARPRGGNSSCLVCSHSGQEACGYCHLSSTVRCLVLLMRPQPDLQTAFAEAAGLEVGVSLLAGLVASSSNSSSGAGAARYDTLLGYLCTLMAAAVAGNTRAQDQVRLAGGIDVLAAAMRQRVAPMGSRGSSPAKQGKPGQQPQQVLAEVAPVAASILQLLAVLVADNAANKLCLRESGAFGSVALLMGAISRPQGQAPELGALLEVLAHAVLNLLAACLPDSPGSQAALHQLGGTARLMQLLRAPSNSPSLGLSTIHVLGLLASRGTPAAQAEATAGGLVAVVMNVLQQQAMSGVLVSEVCMSALPSLLEANHAGKQQALQYGVLPLLVHLLRSSPSPVTLTAAARTLAVLAEGDAALQGQITSAGGLSALLDRLDPAAAAAADGGGAAPPEAQAAAASAAAAAAVTAAAEAVAKAAAEQQRATSPGTGAGGAGADGDGEADGDAATAAAPDGDANASGPTADSNGKPVPAQLPDNEAAAAMAAAAACAPVAPEQGGGQQAAAQRRLAGLRVGTACLGAVSALAHDNSFTKNTARQQGAMALLSGLLERGSAALQAALMAEAAQLRQQHQQQQQLASPAGEWDGGGGAGATRHERGGGLWPHGSHLQVRMPKAPWAAAEQQLEQQQEVAAQLGQLVAALQVLAELCHGNHSNQQAAAAEGLLDQVTSLAALAMGDSLDTAGRHVQLLAAAGAALAAGVEFSAPNKLAGREAGAVDACARLLLMAAEVPDVSSMLAELRLQPALTACCDAVVALAQDCEDNQAAFTHNPDFLPALFRLLSVDDPVVAYQAARALEFIAIRADIADDAEDRGEFEADAAMALVRCLSRGAISSAGSGRTAAGRAAICGLGVPGGAPPPSAAVVREAASLLALVVEASDPAAQQAAAAAQPGGGGGASSGAARGLGTAPAHPALTPTSSGRQHPQGSGSPVKPPAAASSTQPARHASLPAGYSATGQATGSNGVGAVQQDGAVDGTITPPAALLPAVVTDHTSGLAVLRTWSLPQEQSGQWQQLVARSAPAFQHIRASVLDGPWRPFKQQVAWLLLLLAAKSHSNRALLSRVQRTTLTPLAMQLENAERFAEQAAALEAAAAATAAAGGAGSSSAAQQQSAAHHSRSSSSRSAAAEQQASLSRQSSSSLAGAGGGSNASPSPSRQEGGSGASAGRVGPGPSGRASAEQQPYGASAAAGGAAAAVVSTGSGQLDDDELSMLQQEVAFLGLMSSTGSSRGGTTTTD